MRKFFVYVFILIFFNSCAFIQKSDPIYFEWPLKKYKITQKFNSSKKPAHLGIDLKANSGTKVLSVSSGRVVYAGQKFSGYGKVIIIEHSSHWTSLYSHLSQIKVKQNQRVKGGQVIGAVGSTGRSTGPHLHLELMYNKKNVNPLRYLPSQ
ncbi:MAG: M23 family metallopeptidase [Bdellovibrionaceae bacterium]|nr:M23 family metallopeptidase [Pseudobdellovibrionaceae bacterium]